MPRATDWTPQQSAIVVAVYAEMLERELRGERYNKSEYERRAQRETGRLIGAVRYKLQNVSAAFTDLGFAYLKGYVPAVNYQHVLIDLAAELIERDRALEAAMKAAVDAPVLPGPGAALAEVDLLPREGRTVKQVRDVRTPRVVNWLQVEASRHDRGGAGERLVLEWEDRRLRDSGRPDLARRIEHTAAVSGDGAGFDIRSFEEDGADRFIEVKTTAFHAYTPFFVTPNEVAVSNDLADRWHLYRVYDVIRAPRFYRRPGSVTDHFSLEPSQFQASLATRGSSPSIRSRA